jgi:hypothetical protein
MLPTKPSPTYRNYFLKLYSKFKTSQHDEVVNGPDHLADFLMNCKHQLLQRKKQVETNVDFSELLDN